MNTKSVLFFGSILLGSLSFVNAVIEGPPIENNNYRLDLRQGPVIGSAKQVALGGAYIGLAEGINALNSNPAGVAFRSGQSKPMFDWDWTLGTNDIRSSDFDNNGTSPPDYLTHKILTMGLMGQWGTWGLGFLNNGEILKLDNPEGEECEYALNTTSFALGREFPHQQLTLGLGIRTTMIKVRTKRFDTSIGKISGIGWDVGALWHPKQGPVRLGLSYLSKITSHQKLENTSNTPVTVNGLIIPSEATLPSQLGAGISYQVQSAPFYKGHPWLLAADVIMIDSSENAVGIESVLAQKKQSIGSKRTLSIRGGTQLEVFPDRFRARLGSYYEPSFYEQSTPRTHITGGMEMRLFKTTIFTEAMWGLTYTIDVARDYLNQYISIGFWTPN